jgi:ankyrin repeat protein
MQEVNQLGPLLPLIPQDIHPLYMTYLSDWDLARLSRVSKRLRQTARQNAVWKAKFAKHFPHLIPAEEPASWYELFVKTTLDQYPKDSRHLFFIAKEGFLWALEEAFKAKNTLFSFSQANILYDLVQIEDKSFLTPIDWIIRKQYQFFLDTIFSRAILAFTQADQTLNHNKKDKLGWSITHWAVITNQDEMKIEEYLSVIKKNGLFESSFKKISPLHIAAEFGLATLVKMLTKHFNLPYRKKFKRKLEKHGPLETEQNTYEICLGPLHLAAAKGHLNVVETLLECKEDLNQPAREQEYHHDHIRAPNETVKAIHYATANGHLSVAQLLLNRGACAFEEDNQHNSPLTYAVRTNNEALFNLLIQQETVGTIDIMPSLNRALFDAVYREFFQYIQPLIKKGADPYWKHPFSDYRCLGRSAIDIAGTRENREILKLLLGESRATNRGVFKPPNYKKECALALVIPSVLCIGLPSFWLCMYTGKDLPHSLGLIFGLIALFVVGFGLGPIIGYAIGNLLEQSEERKAWIFSQTLQSSDDLEMAIISPHYPPLSVTVIEQTEEESLPLLRRVPPAPSNPVVTPYIGQTFLSPPSSGGVSLPKPQHSITNSHL